MHYKKYFVLPIVVGILLSSCEKKDNSVIDPVLKFPVIDTAGVSPNVFDTSNVSMSIFAHVVSEDVAITKVSVRVLNPANNEVNNIILSDAGNGRYTGQVNFSMDCRYVGTYRVEFTALNNQNLYSNAYPVNFNVINSFNHHPVISNLIIYPRDFTIGIPSILVFLVNASDADGSCDLRDVHYFGKRPNGVDLTEEGLYDDGSCCPIGGFGTSGDTTANDGKYTRFFNGALPDQLGYYKYHIIAIDGSGDTSNVLSDSIYVHN